MQPKDISDDHDDGGHEKDSPEDNGYDDATQEGVPYEVGYKRPPRRTQFKPGNKSGAGKRGPRRHKLVDDVIRKIAKEKVEVTIDGKRVRMPLMEAMIRDVFFSKKKLPRDTLRVIELLRESEKVKEGEVKEQKITLEFVNFRPKGLPGAPPEDQ
jgi:hypothetical protein